MDWVFDLLSTLAGVVSIGLAAWSGGRHFSSDKVPLGSMVISAVVIITTILYIYLLWAAPQPVLAQLVGFVLQVLGITLFWVTIGASRSARLRMAFDEGNPRGLVTQGPYRFVRHPFYTSYLIYFAGFGIATWSPIAIAPYVIVIIIYILAARMEEGKFRNTPMAAEYAAYRERTGQFFPKFGKGLPRP